MTDERDRLIRIVIAEKYEKYTNQIIDLFKAIPDKMSGDDSLLKNAWEKWAYQLQNEQSAFYHVYEEQVQIFCKSVIDEMPPDEIKLLWARRDSDYQDMWEEQEGFVGIGQMKAELEEELLRRVSNCAENEDLDKDE